MGTSGSKTFEEKEEQYLSKLENDAVRAAVPRGLIDEKGNQLKYQLHYCLTRNDWYFTIAGLAVGGWLSYQTRGLQPIAAAALLAPGLDWAYSQSVCAEYLDAYQVHKAKLMEEMKERADEAKRQVREQYSRSTAAQSRGSDVPRAV